MAECWLLQQKSKPNALVCTVSKPLRLSRMVVESKPGVAVPDDKFSVVVPEKKPQEVEPDSTYLPFVSEGLVFLTENDATVPIRILRDTEATQSLLLQDVLPLTGQSSTGTSVLAQGVELGVLKVPLHKVYLRSNLVSGTVTVGVRPALPMQDIAFILGNDLAGGKVNVNPELQVMDEPKTVEVESKDIYPACVVTRSAAARKVRDKGEVSQSDDARFQTELEVTDENEVMRIPEMTQNSPLSREQLMTDQKNDPELSDS